MLPCIEEILAQCEICEKYASSAGPAKSVIPVADGKPFQKWALDIIGPLPQRHNSEKRFIITAVDYATRWPVAWATKDHKGTTVCRFIGSEICAKFGTPETIVTDGGKELVSNDSQNYFKMKNLEHIVTTPYHPQANGRIERLNGNLLQTLEKLSALDRRDWVDHLATALLVAWSRINCGTGYSPFELVYGFKPNTVQTETGMRLVVPNKVPSVPTDAHRQVLEEAQRQAEVRMEKQAIPSEDLLNVGNEVWVLNHDKRKLLPEKLGPTVIIAADHGKNIYTVKDAKDNEIVCHWDTLRVCQARKRQRTSNYQADNEVLSKYGARSEDNVTAIAPEAGDTLKSLKDSSSETPVPVMSLSNGGHVVGKGYNRNPPTRR